MRYLMAAIAILTCPCHLPILVVVLGGTALGGVLSEHIAVTVIALTILFVASAAAATALFQRAAHDAARPRSRQ